MSADEIKATIKSAEASRRGHLQNWLACRAGRDVMGMHYARTGAARCRHVLRLARAMLAGQ